MNFVELHAYAVDCPYCGETFTTSIDPSTELQTYYEDCQVCCYPILFSVSYNSDDDTVEVITSRDNE